MPEATLQALRAFASRAEAEATRCEAQLGAEEARAAGDVAHTQRLWRLQELERQLLSE